jgi:hypothetical protein
MNSFGAILRDRDTGSVLPDPDNGRPDVRHTPSAFDRRHIITGLVAITKFCYLEGAFGIFPYVTELPPLECHKLASERTIEGPYFVGWLNRLKSHDMNSSGNFFGYAHQMGTCRMSTRSTDGMVDDCGKVWEADNVLLQMQVCFLLQVA